MGDERVTVQNLKVVRVDVQKGGVLIRGALPGPRNCDVVIRKSIKKS
jgi:large subunit ribosomal protein L3